MEKWIMVILYNCGQPWMQHSHTACVQYPISHEGSQVWRGDQKLSSHQSSVFFKPSLLGTHLMEDSLCVTYDALLGTYMLWLQSNFHWAADIGSLNIPHASAASVPRWSTGMSSQLGLGQTAERRKMPDMYGYAHRPGCFLYIHFINVFFQCLT
jgi:hypothetical protein